MVGMEEKKLSDMTQEEYIAHLEDSLRWDAGYMRCACCKRMECADFMAPMPGYHLLDWGCEGCRQKVAKDKLTSKKETL